MTPDIMVYLYHRVFLVNNDTIRREIIVFVRISVVNDVDVMSVISKVTRLYLTPATSSMI